MHGVGCHGLSLSIAVFVDGKSKSFYVSTVSCDIATCHALSHLDLIINVCKKKAKGGGYNKSCNETDECDSSAPTMARKRRVLNSSYLFGTHCAM